MKTIKSFEDFSRMVRTDAEFQEQLKQDPVKAMDNVKKNPLDWDEWTYRIVVAGLCVVVMAIVIGR